MAIAHITPQNWEQQAADPDPRQYLVPQTLHYLANRSGLARSNALHLAKKMRGIADALDASKPTAFKGLPTRPVEMGILTPAEVAAEISRLRTMADYLVSIIDEFADDPEPADA